MTDSGSSDANHRLTPILSVVMPVHNARLYLDEAVESILGQSFSEFEFVILDDASTDGSTERLKHWAASDERIRLLQVEQNLGPVGSSNMVARAARAPMVARMDADDFSHPKRLEEQLQLLHADPEIGIVASICDIIDSSGQLIRGPEHWRLLRRSAFVPFAHGSMMYRRNVFDRVGGYRRECEYWEDQDLVIRMASVAKVVMIPRVLYRVRQTATGTRASCDQMRLELALERAYEATDRFENPSDKSLKTQEHLGKFDPRVFIALGSLQLWAGSRPRLFRRLLSRARLSFDARSASAIVWTAWATTSPSSLRSFLKFLLRWRNRLVSARIVESEAFLWSPLSTAEPYTKSGGH